MTMVHCYLYLGEIKKMKIKIKKIKAANLFGDDRFVLSFSIVLSIILWIIISLANDGSDISLKISDIPIDIQLSDNAKNYGLNVFMIDKDTATVSVTGNSMVLSKLTGDSITVTSSQASAIDRSGTYELNLTAKKNSHLVDYEIDQNTLSPKKVKVLVDRYKELTIPITDNINYRTDSQYFAGSTKFLSENITISGPESIVSKVYEIKAEYNVVETLNETKTFYAPIFLYDEDDNRLPEDDLDMLTISNKNIQCEIPIMQKATLPISVDFDNKPENFDVASKVKVTPSTIEIAVANGSAIPDNVMLPKIDFSEVDLSHNKFELEVELPENCKNLSNASTVQVEIDLTGFQFKFIDLNNFQFSNLAKGKKATALTSSIQVEVIGPEDQIKLITEKNITATVDLSSKSGFTGHTEMPVSFTITGVDSCWVFGDYMVSLTID